MGFKVELLYPIQNNRATRISGVLHASPHNDVVKYLQSYRNQLIIHQLVFEALDTIIDGRQSGVEGEKSYHMKKGSQHAMNVPENV